MSCILSLPSRSSVACLSINRKQILITQSWQSFQSVQSYTISVPTYCKASIVLKCVRINEGLNFGHTIWNKKLLCKFTASHTNPDSSKSNKNNRGGYENFSRNGRPSILYYGLFENIIIFKKLILSSDESLTAERKHLSKGFV